MRKLATFIDGVSEQLNRLALWGAVLAVIVMLGAAGWQVIARYALAQPPVWTEELARFSMVWAGLLGASCAFRWKSDPSLFADMQKKTGTLGKLLLLLRSFGTLVFIAPIIWYSIFGINMNPARGYIARLAGRNAETMDLPMALFGIAIPLAFTLILLHLIAALLMGLSDQSDPPPSSQG
ncbi:MAG: TRAP transporter small permease subunit [Sneathiellales bacterium]|nr:TRAP transporter small permease subunit [Sneathiellales bacterium]